MAQAHPLHNAAQSGDASAITTLVESGCDINVRDEYGWSALHHAVHARQHGAVELLLRLGADLHAVEQFGGTPLHWACEVEDVETVRLLLRNGADVNRMDEKGRTPLHDALFKANWVIVELLGRADADWLAEHPVGRGVASPLHLVFTSLDAALRAAVREILIRRAGESHQARRALAWFKHHALANERKGQ